MTTELHAAHSQLTGLVKLLNSPIATEETFQHFHMPEMLALLDELVEQYTDVVTTTLEAVEIGGAA